MEKKSFNNLILVIAVIAIILVVGIGLINAGIITTEKQNLRSNKIQATLIIDYGDETVDGYTLDITNATVYSLLIQAFQENDPGTSNRYPPVPPIFPDHHQTADYIIPLA